MTMFEFMQNAFYMLCGVACVAVSVVIVYAVVVAVFNIISKGKKNGRL